MYGTSRSKLLKLTERLEEISNELESVNLLLGQYFRCYFVENANFSGPARSRLSFQARLYQKTPELLRELALDLRAANAQLAKQFGPKKYDTFRQSVVDLLKYVDTSTKSPHYQEVADLLAHLSSSQRRTLQIVAESLPKPREIGARKKKGASAAQLLDSPDALKALYLRAVKYGFRQARSSKSERLPSA